ncbi:glycosyltransferase family 39 protein [Streptomyces sp. SID13031]|uniref:glycosyltransferase family 39 protein n=1 Tax=Streptomyces sp. SID13031 TaxID=2706046 RepID=UPI0013C96AA3|nr:glycosyltransferase family 39 protein [Streptomyces sp. SID13031]NEA36325.1 glycosyltransferase family 39 protein [Streptomyces sp. SID13031]
MTTLLTDVPKVGGKPRRIEKPALAALLLGTAVLYLWQLGASGTANEYYAAAVQAGSQSWEALFFGSLDAGNVITVDKPPASLWVMGLSARIFGFSSWSMLVPQTLMGVASVALLYLTVRRWHGATAGLLAGGMFALTPVAVLMFRFNNPDALLVLLLVTAAYCMVRACESARTTWLLLAGVAVGFGFLTKMLQAFLVLPAFVLVYLLLAPTPLRRRVLQIAAAGGAVIVSAGWWIALVSVWPASARPYIGGSVGDSALELALGYNGLGRLVGGSNDGGAGSGGAGAGGAGAGGGGNDPAATLWRLFDSVVGPQASWLLPTALLALVLGLVLAGRSPRDNRLRGSLLLWGGWLVVSAGVFTGMTGKFHTYYTVALAPAIAAIIAVTARDLWNRRTTATGRYGLAALTFTTGAWGYVLLARTPEWHPELRYTIAACTVVAMIAFLTGGRTLRIGLVTALATAFLATSVYSVATAGAPHVGNDPVAGPPGLDPNLEKIAAAKSAVPPAELIAVLRSTTTKWAAATSGAQSAAPLALASGRPVIGIGGFSGNDPAPTLAEFQQYVARGEIAYFVAGGSEENGSGRSSNNLSTEITTWITTTFTPTSLGSATLYTLTTE